MEWRNFVKLFIERSS